MKPNAHSKRLTVLSGALAFGVVLGGCQATIDTRGYVPDEEAIGRIKPGELTRNDVQEILGTPSTVTPFSENTWLYIERKTSTIAFFEPKVLEQKVVVVEFNEAGTVTDVRRFTLEDGKAIDPVSRTTPAPGKELTFLEQLVGNVGKFNTEKAARR